FVLKYRLPVDGHENRQYVPLQDAQRAMRYIRANAQMFNINPDSIGVMGGSAGGHLAASLSVFYDWEVYAPVDSIDSLSAKSNLSVLMYPVISFQDNLTHAGSRSNLLGSTITQAMKDSFSTELHVDSMTAPAFLFHSKQDGSVKYQNSEAYADALDSAGVAYSLNLYASGGHGIGKCEAGTSAFSQWPRDLDAWLVGEGWTTPCEGTNPTITLSTKDSVLLIASPAASYQWYRNGVAINGATDSVYEPVLLGTYTVSSPGQREGSQSDCILYSEAVMVESLLSIKDKFEDLVRIYPNPAPSEIIVDQIPFYIREINYVVYDQKGAQVLAGRQMVSNN
ncbi:MAG: prolyl oligopeptidase family serine peptidase, partial [Bacteroidetes bacterium]|nr:prolyl oligopeptidase family serine peptidase [Bacteroidota bacterium]